MASKIAEGLSKVSDSARSRLKGVGGRSYQAASINPNSGRASKAKQLSESLSNFGAVSEKAGHYYVDQKEKAAKQNVKKILDKYPPEMIAELRRNGTILAHDDPYTVGALNSSLAAMSSDKAYTTISQRINGGEYATREDMAAALAAELDKERKFAKDSFGVGDVDEDFDSGWNSDVEQKNIAMYQQMDGFLDQRTKNLSKFASQATQRSTLRSGDDIETKLGALVVNFAYTADSGMAIQDDAREALIQDGVKEIVASPDAVELLAAYGDMEIDYKGGKYSIKDIMGQDMWANLTAKAESSAYNMNFAKKKEFLQGVSEIRNTDDATIREALIRKMEAANDVEQPSNQTSAQKEELAQLRAWHSAALLKEAEALKAKDAKHAQTELRKSELRKQYERYMAGEIVSTAWGTMPENEATGKYTEQDEVDLANDIFNEIDASQLDDDLKTERKLQWVASSPKDSAFRKIFGQFIGDAAAEQQAFMLNPNAEGDFSKMNRARDIFMKNKSIITQMYPESAQQLTELEYLGNAGLSQETLANAQKLRAAKSTLPEIQIREDNWNKLTNLREGGRAGLRELPMGVSKQARVVYDSVVFTGGSADQAALAAEAYVNDNYTRFKYGDNNAQGIIPKNFLMINDDPKTVARGEVLVNKMLEEARKARPDTANAITIEMWGNDAIIANPEGSIRVKVTKQMLQELDATEQAEAAKKFKVDQDAAIELSKAQNTKKATRGRRLSYQELKDKEAAEKLQQ